MRKHIIILISIFLLSGNSWAVIQVSEYTFFWSQGVYSEISGGTVLGTIANDDQRFVDPSLPAGGTSATGPGFPIGFNFKFGEVVFDRLAINANGWISLGQSVLSPSVNISSTSAYAPIGSATPVSPTYLVSRVVALGRDLQGQTGSELRIQTIGVEPERECVIQWKGYRKYVYGGSIGDNFNFQIRLIETTNEIKIIYGDMVNNASSTSIQVGLRGEPATTATNYHSRTTTVDWSATIKGTSNTASCSLSTSIFPSSGLTYIFSSPLTPQLSVVPASLTFGYTPTGENSSVQTYGLSGSNLTSSPITVSAPMGFEVSLDGESFDVSQSVIFTPPNLPNTTVQIRFVPIGLPASYAGVVSNIGGSASANLSVSGSSDLFLSYCSSGSFNSGDEDITLVQFGSSLNNTSACESLAGSQGMATGTADFYSNFTSISPTNLLQGSTVPISVRVTECLGQAYPHEVRVYIDFNQNGFLNDGGEEFIIWAYASSNTHTINANIVVPANAQLGNTLMRIVCQESNTISPCIVDSWGETEDYKVNIYNSSSPLLSVVPGSLNFGMVYPGTSSAELMYLLSGTNLTPAVGDIIITPPANFEISLTSGSNFSSSVITKAYTDGAIEATPIYVVFKPTIPKTFYSGSISNTGGGVTSNNVYTSGFSSCNAITALPWNENFETLTPPLFPDCWYKENGDWVTTNNSNSISDADAHSGTQFLRESDFATNEYIWTPGFSLESGTYYDFSFWWAGDMYSEWEGKVFYNTTPSSIGSTQLGSSFIAESTQTSKTYTRENYSFTPPSTGIYYFAIRINATYSPMYLSFDDFRVALSLPCLAPSSLLVSSIGMTSATLYWTESASFPTEGYEYEIRTSGEPGSGSDGLAFYGSIPAGVHSTSATGLIANTAYSFYVRSNCGGYGYSDWAGPKPFRTLCGATGYIAENFDAVTVNLLPDCWKKFDNSTGYVATTSSTSHTSPNCIYFHSGGNISTSNFLLISPEINNLSVGTHQLRFYAKTSSVSTSSIVIGTMTDPSNWMNFTPYQTVTGLSTSAWKEFIVDFSGYSGTDLFIAFRHPSTSIDAIIYIDDIVWEPAPLLTCYSPRNPLFTSHTTTTADFSWTVPISVTHVGYEWEVRSSGVAGSGANGLAASGTTTDLVLGASATGLNIGKDYMFFVRANCGNNDYSAWTSAVYFATSCSTLNVPYFQDFEALAESAIPACASIQNAGSGLNWVSVSAPGSGFNSRVLRYSWTINNPANAWFYTPALFLSEAIAYRLTFRFGNNSTYYSEKLKAAYGPSAINTAMTNTLLDFPSINQNTPQNAFCDFTPPSTGVYYFGFNCYSDANQYNLYIDDILIELAPVSSTWAGGVSNDWSVQGNWNGGIPGAGTDVTIPVGLTNYPTLTTAGRCRNLTIQSSAAGTGSVLGNSFLAVSGTTTVERYLTKYNAVTDFMFHFLSSPVTGQAIVPEFQTLTSTTTDFYKWGETSNKWINSLLTGGWNPAFESNFTVGAGYLVAYPVNLTKAFTGTLNNGDVSPTLSFTTDQGNGYNLIGNPYPSALDWDNVQSAQYTNLDNAVYVWDDAEMIYKTWVSGAGSLTDGIIPAMQGFFVKANAALPTLTLKNEDRVHGGGYYKNTQIVENMISLKVEGNNFNDETFVRFTDQATPGFDGQWDAYKLMGGSAVPNFYSLANDTKLAVNTLPSSSLTAPVLLNLEVGANATYTLTLEGNTMPSATYVTLEDLKTGNLQRLNDSPAYAFMAGVGDEPNRFRLHFKDASYVPATQSSNGYIINVTDGIVAILSEKAEKGKVSITDMAGRTLVTSNLDSAKITRINFGGFSGVYLVCVITPSGIATQKIIVK